MHFEMEIWAIKNIFKCQVIQLLISKDDLRYKVVVMFVSER